MTHWSRVILSLVVILAGLAAGQSEAQTMLPLPLGPNLAHASGIARGGDGTLFIIDSGSNAVTEIPTAGNYGQAIRLAAASGNFNAPKAIAIDGSGNLFIADTGNNQIKEIVAAGGYVLVETLAADDGAFNAPSGIAVDAGGNVFVADTGNNVVKEIAAAGGYTAVTILAAPFTAPSAMAFDSHGNLFVADSSAAPVKILQAAGGYGTVTPLSSIPRTPNALALDKADNLYLAYNALALGVIELGFINEYLAADFYANSQNIEGSLLNSPSLTGLAIDGSGAIFASSDTGYPTALLEFPPAVPNASPVLLAGGSRSFAKPFGVAVDAAGNVFVVDPVAKTVSEIAAADGYGKAVPLPVPNESFAEPVGLAVDRSGNLFVLDTDWILEVPAEGGYSTVKALGVSLDTSTGLNVGATGIAIDAAGNLFVTGYFANQVFELPAAGGYASAVPIGGANGHFNQPNGIALDAAGNVFVADSGNGVVKEIPAAGGYTTVITLPAGDGKLLSIMGIALDAGGNVYISDDSQAGAVQVPGQLQKISAADGYATVTTVAPSVANLLSPGLIAVDSAGNLYVADSDNGVVKKFLVAPAPLAASVLPGSRAVQAGMPATLFATLLNTGSSDLANCQVGLGAAPAGLSAAYQTTDPATNLPTGTPDTPVGIAAGRAQSFVMAFQSDRAAADPEQVLSFSCSGGVSAPIVPGVDTVDLDFAAAPTQDIIAIAATAPQPGIVSIPIAGAAAFAVATYNAGIEGTLTVSADTGDAVLPLTVALCPTDPSSAQCLAPPSASFQQSFAAGAASTFSVFLGATGPIPFAPGASRIFVRFKDGSGATHGSTSVAVATD